MGKKIVLDMEISDLSAPRLANIDPIESSGSMILIEPGHPRTGALGALTDGLSIPNLFREQARALHGSGSAADMDAVYNVYGAIAGKLLLERTAKGGIHGIATQSDGVVGSGVGVLLNMKTLLRSYRGFLKATGHDIYWSAWIRPTRLSSSQNTVYQQFGDPANSAMNAIYRQGPSPVLGLGSSSQQPQVRGFTGDSSSVLAPIRRAATLVVPNLAQVSSVDLLGAAWGAPNESYNNAVGAFRDDLPSFVQYRMYVEDLTVSGRTHEMVNAIDGELFDAAFAEGGRYYGDTFTNPNTLP